MFSGTDRVAVRFRLSTQRASSLTHLDWKFTGKLRQRMRVGMVSEGKGEQVQTVPKKIKTEGSFLSVLPGEPGSSLPLSAGCGNASIRLRKYTAIPWA